MPKAASLPDPVKSAYDVRRGTTKMAQLPPETQQAVKRMNRFAEGKILSYAGRQTKHKTFQPGPRTWRARLE